MDGIISHAYRTIKGEKKIFFDTLFFLKKIEDKAPAIGNGGDKRRSIPLCRSQHPKAQSERERGSLKMIRSTIKVCNLRWVFNNYFQAPSSHECGRRFRDWENERDWDGEWKRERERGGEEKDIVKKIKREKKRVRNESKKREWKM